MMKFAALIFASLLAVAIASAEEKTTAAAPTSKAPTSAAHSKAANPAKAAGTLPKDIKKMIVDDAIVGQGKEASKGKRIKVNYTGWLYDPSQPMGRGKQFDSSIGKEPFSFQLGTGQVIRGWDEGFDKMKVGGKRKLIIPAEMGYGERGAGGDIPPNSPLMFEVELLDVM
jgi:FKBP-type peptidyl-prolyl cis-trans isomerase FkpA